MSISSAVLYHLSRVVWILVLSNQLAQTDCIDGTPCIPIEGKTALFIGQDYYSIVNYTEALGGNLLGVMSYTCEFEICILLLNIRVQIILITCYHVWSWEWVDEGRICKWEKGSGFDRSRKIIKEIDIWLARIHISLSPTHT